MPVALETLLPYLVFLAITLAVWAILTPWRDRPRSRRGAAQRIMNPASVGKRPARVAGRQDKFQAKVTEGGEQAGAIATSLRRGGTGQGPAQAAQCGIPQRERGGGLYGVKLILMLLGLAIAFPLVVIKLGMTRMRYTITAVCGGVGFYMPGLGRGQEQEEAVGVDLSGLARCTGLDGRLCRGRPRP